MLERLFEIERRMPEIFALGDRFAWHSVDIDYEKPRVERVYGFVADPSHGDTRICLHRMHPCAIPFRHHHPWSSAIRVASGIQEVEVGTQETSEAPGLRIHFSPGSAYEMDDPDWWHSVRPLGVTYSLMVNGPDRTPSGHLWQHRRAPKVTGLNPLTDLAKGEILDFFRAYYCP